ncbi:hypothetical protein BS17DRAFT_788649 [Gyrodon lividus]|nr:hypothetical protein BS17DRAFT_788649 [Gyrodon lividus]
MQSSPLEVLPPDKDDLTRSEMTRRMLKRSRRAALAEQVQDKNIDRTLLIEPLAKRTKHTDKRVVNTGPSTEPLDMPLPQDDLSLQTPFPASEYIHESAVVKPLISDQLSPVPVAKRILSRTSSRNLKENSTHSQTLASPFHSRPSSAVSSPKRKSKARSLRASRISLHSKSRNLSGAFKEDSLRISRKNSTVSLNDNSKHPAKRVTMHQRYPSNPSTSYMRSQVAQQDWFAPPKALSRPFDYDEIPSPHGSLQSDTSFFNSVPQFCSTPLVFRSQSGAGMQAPIDGNESPAPLAHNNDLTLADPVDIEMTDNMLPNHRQTIHISGNSIFSSSGEFTIEPIPVTGAGAATTDMDSILSSTGQNVSVAKASDQAVNRPPEVDAPPTSRDLARSYLGEYIIRLPDSSPVPATAANGPIFVPPASRVLKVSVGKQALVLPRASSSAPEINQRASSATRSFHTARELGTPTPPASPARAGGSHPPSSPAGDLVQEMKSLEIGGTSAKQCSCLIIPR